MNDCDDNVRFALSDDTGDMHFTAFDIVNAPECARLVEELRAKLHMSECCIEKNLNENRRRSLVKALVWRFIGIAWTWIGAYIIMLLIPPSKKTAGLIATLIVIYHHSTRMIMYYFYERIWASVAWGRSDHQQHMSPRGKVIWFIGVVVALMIIFYLIIYVTPWIKNK